MAISSLPSNSTGDVQLLSITGDGAQLYTGTPQGRDVRRHRSPVPSGQDDRQWRGRRCVCVTRHMCNGSLGFPQGSILSQLLISRTDWTTTKPSMYTLFNNHTLHFNTTSLLRPTLLFSQPTPTFVLTPIQSKAIQFKCYTCAEFSQSVPLSSSTLTRIPTHAHTHLHTHTRTHTHTHTHSPPKDQPDIGRSPSPRATTPVRRYMYARTSITGHG